MLESGTIVTPSAPVLVTLSLSTPLSWDVPSVQHSSATRTQLVDWDTIASDIPGAHRVLHGHKLHLKNEMQELGASPGRWNASIILMPVGWCHPLHTLCITLLLPILINEGKTQRGKGKRKITLS